MDICLKIHDKDLIGHELSRFRFSELKFETSV
jgi:hypothetical protein